MRIDRIKEYEFVDPKRTRFRAVSKTPRLVSANDAVVIAVGLNTLGIIASAVAMQSSSVSNKIIMTVNIHIHHVLPPLSFQSLSSSYSIAIPFDSTIILLSAELSYHTSAP